MKSDSCRVSLMVDVVDTKVEFRTQIEEKMNILMITIPLAIGVGMYMMKKGD